LGSTIGERYQVTGILGEGGFSVVYEARQIATGQVVAIKVLRLDRVSDAVDERTQIARFEREMKVTARLKHPNIVRLIDSGRVDEGELFMVFDYVQGETLAAVLGRDVQIDPPLAKHLMCQVLDALSAAHEIGIVHRDLKPRNIMITDIGARRNALVLDFGIAALGEEARDVDYAKLTRSGMHLGTPTYMAPEQLSGAPLTALIDVYAWGLIFFECLVGRRAVVGKTVAELFVQHLSPDPIALPDILEGHPLGRVLHRALAKRVEDRYPSARAAFSDLEACDVTQLRIPRFAALPTRPPRAAGSPASSVSYSSSGSGSGSSASPPGSATSSYVPSGTPATASASSPSAAGTSTPAPSAARSWPLDSGSKPVPRKPGESPAATTLSAPISKAHLLDAAPDTLITPGAIHVPRAITAAALSSRRDADEPPQSTRSGAFTPKPAAARREASTAISPTLPRSSTGTHRMEDARKVLDWGERAVTLEDVRRYSETLPLTDRIRHTIEQNLLIFPLQCRVRGLFFTGLHEIIKRSLGPEAHAEACRLSGIFSKIIPFNEYPHRDFYRLMYWAAAYLHKNPRFGESLTAIASTFFPIFRESLLGRTTAALMGKNLKTQLPRLAVAYNSMVRWNQHETEVLSENEVRWTCKVENVVWYAETLTGIIAGACPETRMTLHTQKEERTGDTLVATYRVCVE
jgi:uncharacterized protein (TIGR02265 family)